MPDPRRRSQLLGCWPAFLQLFENRFYLAFLWEAVFLVLGEDEIAVDDHIELARRASFDRSLFVESFGQGRGQTDRAWFVPSNGAVENFGAHELILALWRPFAQTINGRRVCR